VRRRTAVRQVWGHPSGAEISRLWAAYAARGLDGEEAKLAKPFTVKRAVLVKDGLLRAIELQSAGRFGEANLHAVRIVGPSFTLAHGTAQTLLELRRTDVESQSGLINPDPAIRRNPFQGQFKIDAACEVSLD
jgi:hypothetical protein